ncbi:MAG: hypothetical protein ACFB2X_16930 [Rivularia sp. (in: cyanobacteria)]
MTQIVCLANSWKHGERCIAGINRDTKKWIRPVCSLYPHNGKVPKDIRLIHRREPALLDILDIPLEKDGPDYGFESENITIASGRWQRLGQVQPTDLLEYCHNFDRILHNSEKYVTVPFLKSLPFPERRSLELVYAKKFSVRCIHTGVGTKWKGTLETNTAVLADATITDPVFVKKLELSYRAQNPCLVTVSLSMPHRFEDWEGDDPCWKLIAGAIELSDSDLILVEMKRIGWSIEQGRSYLKRNYNRCSRQQLNNDEITGFLNYLTSLPSV